MDTGRSVLREVAEARRRRLLFAVGVDVRYAISDIRYPDIRYPISDIRYPISEVRVGPRTSEISRGGARLSAAVRAGSRGAGVCLAISASCARARRHSARSTAAPPARRLLS